MICTDFHIIIRMMKSQIMMLSKHLLCVEDVSNSYRVLVENMKERNHLVHVVIYWRVMLKWHLKKCDVRLWTVFMWLRIESTGRPF